MLLLDTLFTFDDQSIRQNRATHEKSNSDKKKITKKNYLRISQNGSTQFCVIFSSNMKLP